MSGYWLVFPEAQELIRAETDFRQVVGSPLGSRAGLSWPFRASPVDLPGLWPMQQAHASSLRLSQELEKYGIPDVEAPSI